MSALMNPSQPSRPPAGRAAAPPSAASPSSPQANIFVPDYPVAGFSPQNPHYFEKPDLYQAPQQQQQQPSSPQQYRSPQSQRTQQGTSSQQSSPQEKRAPRPSSSSRVPDTRTGGQAQPSSSRTGGQERAPTHHHHSNQQQSSSHHHHHHHHHHQSSSSRTHNVPLTSAAAMAGASAAAAAAAGPSSTSYRVGPGNGNGNGIGGTGTGTGAGAGSSGYGAAAGGGGFGGGDGGGAAGTGAGGVGGSGGAGGGGPPGGGKGSPPDNHRSRRPSESTRGPKLLTAAGNQPTAPISAAAATASPFPHAFERWEMLSAQWEGLTRYWNRRLEQHQEEISRDPLAVQMSRNITDLSAAGANLFHAVVELQRLRASSERKFQRWFFETKADQERSREMTSELENTLRNERQKRADAMAKIAKLEKDKSTAEKLVEEVRRELQISREEARRAWEELGRREQEERERTNSLRGGHPTLVGGVQVLPMPMPGVPGAPGRGAGGAGNAPPGGGGGGGGPGSTSSAGARPRTAASGPPPSSHGGHPAVTPVVVQPVSQPTGPTGDVVHPTSPQYSAEALSEENVYIGQGDAGYHIPTLHHEPHLPQVPSPPPMAGQHQHQHQHQQQQQPPPQPPSQSSASPFYPQPSPSPQHHQQGIRGPTDPAAFYQQAQQVYLHQVPERTFSPGEDSVVSEPGRPSSQASVTISDPGSDDEDDPWAREEDGRVFRDEQGRAMTQSQVEQRQHLAAAFHHPLAQPYQYYPGLQQPQLQHQQPHQQPPSLQQQQQQQQGQAPPPGQQPPGGYGFGPGWEGITRHHHPTRLSEILEEEERTTTSLSVPHGPYNL
ncbi:hypothetical protein TWF696_005288 [Orbilia brochopaga]|uniref:Uncharacterized protein n=1 Tax=Orbilia brochopaga TaxID=3140254 RepID=A0AAV9V206_9PEZI